MDSKKNIDVEKVKRFWVEEAEESLRVAEHLVEREDFSYALFFGHLALEKMIKGVCVGRRKEHAPPVHNLVRLAGVADIELDEETKKALVTITGFNVESRYPDFKRTFRTKCTQAFTAEQMKEIKRILEWLRSLLK